jgi:Peptidase A4 family
MTARSTIRKAGRRKTLLALTASGGLLAFAAPAGAATSISDNWAGYVDHPATRLGGHFDRVAGSWTEPAATCPSGHSSYSAVWVGLGGYSSRDDALEQIGTDADCSHGGTAHYSAWFELLPAAPVDVDIKLSPGDRLTASVTVSGRRATLRLDDVTSGERFSATRRLSSVDVSTAEWIVEAPSQCGPSGNCHTLPLANFGEVAFSSATATADRHSGTIEDSDFLATELLLRQSGSGGTSASAGPGAELVSATPSDSSGAYGSFSVNWALGG